MSAIGKLDDESVMPFGMHKGRKLKDVPAKYLLWLSDAMKDDNMITPIKQALLVYCAENHDALEEEASNDDR